VYEGYIDFFILCKPLYYNKPICYNKLSVYYQSNIYLSSSNLPTVYDYAILKYDNPVDQREQIRKDNSDKSGIYA